MAAGKTAKSNLYRGRAVGDRSNLSQVARMTD
jgi:hypothetical protein